jgi:DNA-binding transcriptional ArsR family regulator
MSALCDEIEKFGKGIGNASRYKIVEALIEGPKGVGELVKVTALSQPLVSQHLKTLKNCNLVTDQRQGQEVIYTINSSYMLGLLKNLAESVQKREPKNPTPKQKKQEN